MHDPHAAVVVPLVTTVLVNVVGTLNKVPKTVVWKSSSIRLLRKYKTEFAFLLKLCMFLQLIRFGFGKKLKKFFHLLF